MLNLLLLDDEYLVRKGISETIEWHDYGIHIIGEAPDGMKGLELAIKFQPDIVITDIRMPIMDGLEFMNKLKENGLNPGVIVLSGFEDFNYARSAMQNGALAYLLKPIDNDLLIDTVKSVVSKIMADRNTKQYLKKLENEMPAITRQFLLDLIINDIKDEEKIKEKINLLNIAEYISDYYFLVIKIDDYDLISKQISSDKLNYLKELIKQLISDIFINVTIFKYITINKSDDEIIIFLHIKHKDIKAMDLIKFACHALLTNFSKSYTYTLSIGISNLYDDFINISKAYNEAFAASKCKLLQGSSSLVHINETAFLGYRKEIRDAIKYIRNNYSKDITVELVAKDLYISPSHLMHIFKKELGKTFNECLTDYRINMAKELLLDSRYKIYEVSTSIGYGDVKYFSQIFKKATGMTPSDYIKIQS